MNQALTPNIVRPMDVKLDIEPHWNWKRQIPAPGHTEVDFERRVDRFFLSRPVPAGAYFWKRFTLGWVWVLAATAIPAAVAWVLASWNRTYSPAMGQPAWLPGGGLRESARIQAGDFLVYVVPAFSLLYAGAVAAAAFLRWRVAAMILSLALPFGHYLLLAVLGLIKRR